MTEFRLEIDGVKELVAAWDVYALPEIQRGAQTALRYAIEQGASLARQLAPSVTGNLRSKITAQLTQSTLNEAGAMKTVEGEIKADTPYASWVENGTRAHIIRPKMGSTEVGPVRPSQGRRKKDDIGTTRVSLRWKGDDGVYHFAREIHHPGSKPHPFFGPAYFKTEQALEAKLDEEIEIAIDRFNARGL